MDTKVRHIVTKALDLPEDAADERLESALSELGVPGGRLFTQEEVNTLLGANKRHLRTENERLQQTVSEAAATLTQLTGDDPNEDVALATRLERAAAQIVAYREQADEARSSERRAKALLDQTERDRVLVSAAGRAGMIDPEGEGLPLFRDRVRRTAEGDWAFVTDDGDETSLDAGLPQALESRRHLLRPRLAPGAGAGAPREADPLAAALERVRRAGNAKGARDDRALFELADAVLDAGRARRT